MKYCATASPNWNRFRKQFDSKYFEQSSFKDDGQPLFVEVRYVVLYASEEQKLSRAYIVAAHSVLNKAFNGQNETEINKIPDNERYPWRPLVR